MGEEGRERQKVFSNAYMRFIELFNAEEFWEGHEVLEGAWRQNASTFYKGLIIYASAFVHAQRGNPRGVSKQLAKATKYLPEYAPHYLGIDVADLLQHLEECEELVNVSHPPQGEALADLIPFPTLCLSPSLVRGDEPELQYR